MGPNWDAMGPQAHGKEMGPKLGCDAMGPKAFLRGAVVAHNRRKRCVMTPSKGPTIPDDGLVDGWADRPRRWVAEARCLCAKTPAKTHKEATIANEYGTQSGMGVQIRAVLYGTVCAKTGRCQREREATGIGGHSRAT